MSFILTVDFGSTFTKLTAIDLSEGKIVGSSRAFTTIEKNVMDGYNEALTELTRQCGSLAFEKKLAASSAAGGLKMVSVGLVPDLTAKASRLAAASAGAKVMKTYSYDLSCRELDEIYNINPDIILLSGGIDGGNKDVIINNAKALSTIDRGFAVIVAGNKAAGDTITQVFTSKGKKTVLCENVMPEFNKLNITPSRNAIRDLFIENIISAKGLADAQRIMSMEIIPTPLAVFNGAELLARGCGKEEGIGELVIIDVGGATTDVCSMADGAPRKPDVFLSGFKEPFAKRTVEGDIGVRYSVRHLAEAAGVSCLAEAAGVTDAEVLDWVKQCSENPELVADVNTKQRDIDEAFAAFAVYISTNRHTGYLERTYTAVGEVYMQTGKDLTGVKNIIGTGGSVIGSDNPRAILKKGCFGMDEPFCLKPISPEFLLDSSYCFSSMGLLSAVEPIAALKIMKRGLEKI